MVTVNGVPSVYNLDQPLTIRSIPDHEKSRVGDLPNNDRKRVNRVRHPFMGIRWIICG